MITMPESPYRLHIRPPGLSALHYIYSYGLMTPLLFSRRPSSRCRQLGLQALAAIFGALKAYFEGTDSIVTSRSIVIMNKYHKDIIIIGASVIILMLLFPPFHVMYAPGIEIYKGYAFILNPPKFWGSVESTVDINLLLFQVTTFIILIGSVVLFLKMNNK